MGEPRVVIVGGGPAGVSAALQLRRGRKARVTLVEALEEPGGLARSFDFGDQRVDLGSHRLHPACPPEIMADIRQLLGDRLLERPRNGRIRMGDAWLRFPLDPVELARRLDGDFSRGMVADLVRRLAGAGISGTGGGDGADFGTVLRDGLGPTITERFYRPYARKIWGLELEEMAPEQARRRVSASSPLALVRKALGRVPGLRPPGAGRYYYTTRGIGGIAEAYARAAGEAGARMMMGWRLVRARRLPRDTGWSVVVERSGRQRQLDCDLLWSTIPLTTLLAALRPAPPPAVRDALAGLRYRSMLLVYLQLDTDRLSGFDAHYFPGLETAITRLSEPKSFTGADTPRGTTVVCGELPCDAGDPTWSSPDAEIVRRVVDDLETVGMHPERPPVRSLVLRQRHAYPLYPLAYESAFSVVDDWVREVPGLLSFGRQGLFAHDNIHHAFDTGYSAAASFRDGRLDPDAWAACRRRFAHHVVQD